MDTRYIFNEPEVDSDWWSVHRGDGPVIAVALHAGHQVRSEVAIELAISEQDRLREEDPFTDRWASIAPTRVIVHRSRFEVDLNRARDQAIYRSPDQAWGLDVYRRAPSPQLCRHSLAIYDAFYSKMEELLATVLNRHQRAVVLDLHTYNHRRAGHSAAAAPADENPEMNIGTGSMDRQRWSGLVENLIERLSGFEFDGRQLDVRENVRFRGGHFSAWCHQRYPETVCVPAIEVKKFFMDEWTGQADERQIELVRAALASAVPVLHQQLTS